MAEFFSYTEIRFFAQKKYSLFHELGILGKSFRKQILELLKIGLEPCGPKPILLLPLYVSVILHLIRYLPRLSPC